MWKATWAIGIALAASPVTATTYQADPGNFAGVFMAAQGGDTIVVSGHFGATNLVDRSFTVPLTIDATSATFDNSLVVRNVSGVDFTGGTFGSTTGAVRYNAAIAAYSDSNVNFTHAIVIGAQRGVGIALISGNNVSVTNSSFTGLDSGVEIGLTTQASLDRNQSTQASGDGFDIAGSHRVSVTGSTCSAGSPGAGAHPDCVQLFSIKGQPVQSDITVRHNTATGATQGFTAFNPGNGGGLRYDISYNDLTTSYPQGVACYACVDSAITFNTLRTIPGSAYQTNLHINGGADNIVFGNTLDGQAAPDQSPLPQPFDPALPTDLLDPAAPVVQGLSPELGAVLDWNASTFAGLTTSSIDASPAAVQAVPEPAEWTLFLAGFGIIGIAARRRSLHELPSRAATSVQ